MGQHRLGRRGSGYCALGRVGADHCGLSHYRSDLQGSETRFLTLSHVYVSAITVSAQRERYHDAIILHNNTLTILS